MSRARGMTARRDCRAALLESPDLIVLDLNLPGLDGFAVLGRLREAQAPPAFSS